MARKVLRALLPVFGILLGGPAIADEVGKQFFMDNCSVCHGDSGKGDGYLSGFLNVGLPDLTTITARNDGVFPMLKIIHVVDGRTGVRGHGGDMPLWGERFERELVGIAGEYGAEMIIRGRVLSIAYYLESIQE